VPTTTCCFFAGCASSLLSRFWKEKDDHGVMQQPFDLAGGYRRNSKRTVAVEGSLTRSTNQKRSPESLGFQIRLFFSFSRRSRPRQTISRVPDRSLVRPSVRLFLAVFAAVPAPFVRSQATKRTRRSRKSKSEPSNAAAASIVAVGESDAGLQRCNKCGIQY